MKFVVTLNDGRTIEPIYEPFHAKHLVEFYTDKFSKGEIAGWKIEMGQGVGA